MRNARISAVAFKSAFGATEQNLARMIEFVEKAASEKADLVCFPEIAIQGYFSDAEAMRQQAQTLDGPVCLQLTAAAKQNKITITTGLVLRKDEKLFNAQIYVGPDGVIGYSTKNHAGPGGHDAGCDGGDTWPVFDLGFAKVGTLICYDAEFPEAARSLALDGAEIILMSFATGRCDSCGRAQPPQAWAEQVLQWAPAKAYENRVFVVGFNHAGDVLDDNGIAAASWLEPGSPHRWPGYCFAISPDGQVIAATSNENNDEKMLIVDLQAQTLDHWRQGGGNFLKYRRPELYDRLT